ncbi:MULTISPECIES: VWA domain-containing protein [unclassified Mycolicibacterium]|uniref:VWA domain-containing protein n=1 Tax=unclassified Mycolicibacterium TaxID=2636767 RepID=UPI0012DE2FC8|nr:MULTISPECIES: VWA domain-containing protein [unclassified Mycolicibacterium]MUL80597.1 VWA domain-containing protein [Mycolicibacterium sp. CBMA 329]MUL86364.1 VWA domain-containing protein [Mycolicibacterium sp. CBMA 331]MUM01226.1 VWA domain-containing protein [Mycolicibacterium sp. CBMA 334]MUM26844.1 VWA domain-containing protein [Mycolicibacterium sp. CBMA 295]MUM36660.1 VWA domain-containing protein [Mycolicibacterium sp. CBMA 247]
MRALSEPGWLALLAVPAALLALYVVAQIRRQRLFRRFTGRTAPRRWTRHLPVALALCSMALLTVALAGPTREIHIPRNRAVIMLVIDESRSMGATDVTPTRLAAAQDAAKQFADQLTPGVNLGLVAFAGNAALLVSPTPDHKATAQAVDHLSLNDATATGEAIFTALQSISSVGQVLAADNSDAPPARIVLESDGAANKPANPDNPRGAYTAARAAKDQGVPVSTIAFGTKGGSVELDNKQVPVPVDDEMLKHMAALSGGQSYDAANIDDLSRDYQAIQQQIGYQTINGPDRQWWVRASALAAVAAAGCALIVNRRLPV